MRISDGSSDVCSSDLLPVPLRVRIAAGRVVRPRPLVHHGPARQADRQPQHPAYGRLPLACLPDRRPFLGVLTMGWIASFFFSGGITKWLQIGLGIAPADAVAFGLRSEEHTSELPSLMPI